MRNPKMWLIGALVCVISIVLTSVVTIHVLQRKAELSQFSSGAFGPELPVTASPDATPAGSTPTTSSPVTSGNVLSPKPTSPPSTSSQSASSASGQAQEWECSKYNLPANSTGLPETMPETTWTSTGTGYSPSIEGVGPALVEGYRRSCYARSPMGATTFVANLMGVTSDNRYTPDYVKHNVVPGPGRDIELRRADPNEVASREATQARVHAVRIIDFTPERAMVDIVARLTTGKMYSIAMEVKWVEGDWKWQLTDEGKPRYPMETVHTTDGYTKWSAGK